MTGIGSADFHLSEAVDLSKLGYWTRRPDQKFGYTFENYFHPFVSELVQQLERHSIEGLFDPKFTESLSVSFFDTFYTSLTSELVSVSAAPAELDLTFGGPYAVYNWELLFHVPFTIAVHLSKNQRFAEARRWFHFIFDPTANDTATPVPQRYWKFLPFRRAGQSPQIDEQLAHLSTPSPQTEQLLAGLEAIRSDPFQPHKVARTRHLAYQYAVVMAYLDNLVAWGDDCFAQDTTESINEASQLYVQAANLLGHRPQRVPQLGTVRPRTYAELKKQGLDAMGNALVELEGKFPLNLATPAVDADDPEASGPLFGLGRTLYFCVPRNEKLLGYWDLVGDRLFKIRHGLNLEGVARPLALFDPPIDPGLLVKAAAAGLDIASVVGGMNQPLSPARGGALLAQALELCRDLSALGQSLLATIEKGQSEELALLRETHELRVAKGQQDVRFLQWASAQETTRSLLVSRRAAVERLRRYERLLGLTADPQAPEELPVDFTGLDLTEQTFAPAYAALVGQYDRSLSLVDAGAVDFAEGGRAKLGLTTSEDEEFEHLKRARDTGMLGSAAQALAATFVSIPDVNGNMHFWGLGMTMSFKVGTALSAVARLGGNVLGIVSAWERDQAQLSEKSGRFERRADEWRHEHNQAAHEVMQVGRQILTSMIAEQIAHHEYRTVVTSIENTREVDRFLRTKFAGTELYAWMQGELSRLYYERYRFAHEVARKAERRLKHDLMRPELEATDFVRPSYWDAGRKGLLAAEALYGDLKGLELACLESDRREYELTKNISLRQLDPVALIALRVTGRCDFHLPEWLFDLDTPGHYLRRIRSVALTVPCVVGPYAGVTATLALTRSSVRTSPLLGDGYARSGSEDVRFVDYLSASQSIVTSTGQQDRGLFEDGVRDDRPLPFDGAGVISSWSLDLPTSFPQLDRATISDVVLHVRFTAREAGVQLRQGATDAAGELLGVAGGANLGLPLSLRHDFGTEWSVFARGAADLSVVVRRQHFPYLAQGRTITVTALEVFGAKGTALRHHALGDAATLTAATAALADGGEFTVVAPPDPAGPVQVITRDPTADVWLVVRYQI